ncbi:MAG TPA: hypothetical protein GX717_09755 [Clostridiaceae bacterium]|nr:hypothetical protein [Clostridiaceae bacterium]
MKNNHRSDDEKWHTNSQENISSDAANDAFNYWLSHKSRRSKDDSSTSHISNGQNRSQNPSAKKRYSDINIEGVFNRDMPVASFNDEDGEITYYAEPEDYFNEFENEDEFFDYADKFSESDENKPLTSDASISAESTEPADVYDEKIGKTMPFTTGHTETERDQVAPHSSRKIEGTVGAGTNQTKRESKASVTSSTPQPHSGVSTANSTPRSTHSARQSDRERERALHVMPTTKRYAGNTYSSSTSRSTSSAAGSSRSPHRSRDRSSTSGNRRHQDARCRNKKRVSRRRYKPTVGDIIMRVVTIVSVVILVVALLLFLIWRYIIGAANTNVTETPQFITNDVGETVESTTQPVVIRDGQIINILLMGLDLQKEGEEISRSDTMMLATIDQRTNSVRLTSFQRDMLVFVPGLEEPVKINAASHYGPNRLIETLNNTFLLDIQDYIMFNIAGAEDIIDAVGGIEINVPDDPAVLAYMRRLIEEQNVARYGWEDRSQWSPHVWEGGTQLLNGCQAIAYSRMRELDSDFRRMERQQEVVEKMFNKILNSDPITVANVLRTGLSHVTTNMSDIELTQMGTTLLPKLHSKVEHFQIPVDGYFWMDNRDVWCIRANFNLLIPILHQYVYGTNIGEFISVPLVPYTPLAKTEVEFMPDEVLYGTYYAIPYTGAYGQEGGVLLDGNAMETSLPPSPSETSDLVYDDVTPPGHSTESISEATEIEYGPQQTDPLESQDMQESVPSDTMSEMFPDDSQKGAPVLE